MLTRDQVVEGDFVIDSSLKVAKLLNMEIRGRVIVHNQLDSLFVEYCTIGEDGWDCVGLPTSLKYLFIISTKLRTMKLHHGLRGLYLQTESMTEFDEFPETMTQITLSRVGRLPEKWPPHVKTLNLQNIAHDCVIPIIPSSVNELRMTFADSDEGIAVLNLRWETAAGTLCSHFVEDVGPIVKSWWFCNCRIGVDFSSARLEEMSLWGCEIAPGFVPPEEVIDLQFTHCRFDAFARSYPRGLQHLKVSSCYVGDFGELPPGLKTLECGGSTIIELPKLPENLQHLKCQRASIDELPKLPTGLVDLHCSAHQIERLSRLPKGLQTLNLDDRRSVKWVPEIPPGCQIQYYGPATPVMKPLPPMHQHAVASLMCLAGEVVVTMPGPAAKPKVAELADFLDKFDECHSCGKKSELHEQFKFVAGTLLTHGFRCWRCCTKISA
jgi:hypothetical protein